MLSEQTVAPHIEKKTFKKNVVISQGIEPVSEVTGGRPPLF
jgi:hypothetical protein